MTNNFLEGVVIIGDWQVNFASGQLRRNGTAESHEERDTRRLEPKSSQVLAYLAAHPGELVTKQALTEAVWTDSYASDETLARTVSRLRTSLGDDPRVPHYIETLPKRGYRLVARVAPLQELAGETDATPAKPPLSRRVMAMAGLLIAAIATVVVANLYHFDKPVSNVEEARPAGSDLLARADDYYHQMRLADNEMAISLYQQQIELTPDAALAYAGLANSLVQRVVRWSEDSAQGQVTLTKRVASGALDTETAQNQLRRARVLAEKAVALAPENAATLKALGFVLSAQGDYARAIKTYEQALDVDATAWQVWLNKAELNQALGQDQAARDDYVSAFQAMTARYEQDEVQIRPWYADLGTLIGDQYLALENYQDAEYWYRKVLNFAPVHEQATLGLAVVLQETGDAAGGLRLCEELKRRLQASYACAQRLAERKSRAD